MNWWMKQWHVQDGGMYEKEKKMFISHHMYDARWQVNGMKWMKDDSQVMKM